MAFLRKWKHQTLLDLSGPSGATYAVGNFAGTGDQVLIYSANAGTSAWGLGSFDSSGAMTWAAPTNNPMPPFDPVILGIEPLIGNFGSRGGFADVLYYLPNYGTGDGSWWIGVFDGGAFNWASYSNTTTGMPVNSDQTDVSHKVGAIGWPDNGIPWRALEIAMAPTIAFSFLQNNLLEPSGLLQTVMLTQNKPLIGYISIRVCPPTATLMGMQQFSPYSVMIEIVGYRSPESDVLMDQIQSTVLSFMQANPGTAMLHWGLETDQMTAADLLNTPVSTKSVSSGAFTNLQAFQGYSPISSE